ncbi:MAG: glycosyltransferase [Phocaeicola sp.]
MNLIFACEQRFIKCNDKYYVDSLSFGDILWERYLHKFSTITVFARVNVLNEIPTDSKLYAIENSKVSFIDVPYYIGLSAYLKKRKAILKIAKQTASDQHAYICRVPGRMGSILSAALRDKQIPYAVEVVGDPWDVFAPGAINHPLSPIFRIHGYTSLRNIVNKADAALYVTKQKLQKRYPVKKYVFATGASDVVLRDEHLIAPKKIHEQLSSIQLLAVGSLEQMYKSPDIAVKTILSLKNRGINATLTWLGEGKYRIEMEKLATNLGVNESIFFKGNVSPDEVRKELKKADIFLHISRTEGLPRAIIEAMAAGLPCIGSKVGGIPELLSSLALVDAITPEVVADKINLFLKDFNIMNQQAILNFKEAEQYTDSKLNKKREDFYNEVLKLNNH